MTNAELVTAADVQLMQSLAQRVTATRPDLVNSDASFQDRAYDPLADGFARRPSEIGARGSDETTTLTA